jgi:glucose-1-phosphate cytidylyltransferase
VKVGILAGGVGSRLAEETETKPKPMVEIGGYPILWHIMKRYHHFGFSDFVIALGYKGEYIKRYFLEYAALHGDLSICGSDGAVSWREGHQREDWKIDLIETGEKTQTGGRIKRLAPYIGDKTFMLTWGDGVADIDLNKLLEFHKSHGRLATVTAVRPIARFGKLDMLNGQVVRFSEKPQMEEGWINGAFFVLEPEVFEYVEGDDTQWEKEPMERLSEDGQLMAYCHESFWQCMDSLREKVMLESMWQSGQAPWRCWD